MGLSKPAASREMVLTLSKEIYGAVERVTRQAAERIKALEARVAELEKRTDEGLQYEGSFEAGREYRRNVAVTAGGNVWISRRATSQRPGDGNDWTLAVRAGRDAR